MAGDEGEVRRLTGQVEALRARVRELEAAQGAPADGTYRQVFEAALEGFVILDSAGRILDVNDAYCRMLGYARGELIGLSIRDTDAVQSPEQIVENLRRIRTTRHERLETRLKRKDGALRDVEVSVLYLDAEGGRLFSFARDITDRERAAEALRESERLHRTLVEANPYGIQEVDVAGAITYVNRAYERMTGYRRRELLGRNIAEFFLPETERAALTEYLAMLVRDQPAPTTYHQQNRTRDGRTIDVDVDWNYKRDDAGRVVGFISVITDVTERNRAERERRELDARVRQTQKLESLGVLAGGIAHDFNNLLMVVLGNADMALRDLSRVAPARPHVVEVKTAAARAAELTSQMLAYSGGGSLRVKPVDLNELIEEMGHLLGVTLPKKVVLRYDLAAGIPAVEADASQLRQVVMNLISNAAEAVGEAVGAVSLTTGVVAADRAYLSGAYLDEAPPEGDYVFLAVSDTGCGMDADTLARIFDPFYTTKFTGRGLGLAAVLGIVRGHRGIVKVNSEPGQGTTFKVLLPCSDCAAEPEAPAEPADEWRGRGTVLLADDEAGIRRVVGKMLADAGFAVLTAADGREAVSTFAAHADEVSVVLLDMTMPRMSGEEALRELRRIRADVRVVLSSGYSRQEATSRFVGEGLAAFIQKPYEHDSLMATLRDVLERP